MGVPAPRQLPSEPARIFGLVVIEQRKAMTRLVGSVVVERAIALLPAEQRHEIEGLGLLSWCRTSTAAAFISSVAEIAGRDPEGLTAEVVRAGFGTVLRGAWRVFMRHSSDEALVRRSALIYAKAVSCGRASAHVLGPGHLALDIGGWYDITRIDIVALATGIETALRAAGRTAVRVSSLPRDDGVRFEVRLTPSIPSPTSSISPNATSNLPSSASFPPRAESAPPSSASFPPRADSAPPRGASFPPRAESAPPSSASFPPRTESAPPSSASFPPRADSAPPRGASFPPRADSAPPRGDWDR